MLRISEDLLQFIWKHRLLLPGPLRSVSGIDLDILKVGDHNQNSGPDFFNAKIKVGEIVLAGNVEVHIRTSDWLKHGHQGDRSYDNIILHVVYEHDQLLSQNTKNNVEVLELKDFIADQTLFRYHELFASAGKLPCAGQISRLDHKEIAGWLGKMTAERLEFKRKKIESLLGLYNGDYVMVFYTLLMRNFGFKVNSEPFELLAKSISIQTLLKSSDNLLQLEAMLLGMAGFLNEQYNDQYPRKLQNEFEYLRKKYSLVPLPREIFKFSRMRPANFPTLRLVQLASLIHYEPAVFSSPGYVSSFEEILSLLCRPLQGYWKDHYLPDGILTEHPNSFGRDSAENVIINTFAPFFYDYGIRRMNSQVHQKALELLSRCNFEDNQKTRLFSRAGLARNSADSQGLINLYDHYCACRRCLSCGVAAVLLKGSGSRTEESMSAHPRIDVNL
jgi:hypothetical protein